MVCDRCALFLLKFEKIEGVRRESARESAKHPKGSAGRRKDFRRKTYGVLRYDVWAYARRRDGLQERSSRVIGKAIADYMYIRNGRDIHTSRPLCIYVSGLTNGRKVRYDWMCSVG